jgi:N-acetylglucosaminyldiphosphoundecaprenol N-acetyl-beta-D-mannosaminyltransferase
MNSKDGNASVNVVGLKLSLYPRKEALNVIYDSNDGDAPRDVHFLNSYTVYLCQKDKNYEELVNSSWINLLDGKPLSWATKKIFGFRAAEQVRGPELFKSALLDQNNLHLSHYFIGGTNRVKDGLLGFIARSNPSLKVAGFECPPFRELTSNELKKRDDAITNSGAAVVWVGLGTPKQDIEARRIAESTGKIVFAVGAAFDFLSGAKPEAPRFVQSLGLEWLFRLLSEPRRLWKRYLIGNLSFISTVARHAIGRRNKT